uniref:Uncharacterized protein n=1 Tax=Spongospora subterranea TaxID=70186 RepID=A0A0H5QRJ1_9EUKA|eukprot:CRZ04141.1 hypothetical protein [Spongospora subterranea]
MEHTVGQSTSGIFISDDEFARVIQLKADRDELSDSLRLSQQEQKRLLLDAKEHTSSHRIQLENNKQLQRTVDALHRENSDLTKKYEQLISENSVIKKRFKALEGEVHELKNQLVIRNSDVLQLEEAAERLKADLNEKETELLRQKVDKSKVIVTNHQQQELEKKIVKLEKQLEIKRTDEILSEKKLAAMQVMLSELQSAVENASSQKESKSVISESTDRCNGVVSFNPSPFMDACSKAQLLVKIFELEKNNRAVARNIYLRGVILFTILIIVMMVYPF